jgi:hypothetical protein
MGGERVGISNIEHRTLNIERRREEEVRGRKGSAALIRQQSMEV